MIVRRTLSKDQKPTPEQVAQIREAMRHPITFDEDCPDLTPETYAAFQKAVVERNRRNQAKALMTLRETV